MVSVRTNVFTPQESPKAGSVETLDVSLEQADFGAVVRRSARRRAEKLDVAEAPIVVAGGRGLREPENFKLIEELADALGGAARRRLARRGRRRLAPARGAGGPDREDGLAHALLRHRHLRRHPAPGGMRTSKYIVAINKDPEAPIFKVADYGIVGDLFEVVPRLTEEVRKLRG